MTRKTNTKSIARALDTIAQELKYEQVVARKDGGEETINILAYTQKKVLNGICYSVALQLSRTGNDIDDAKAKVQLAARSHRGDELSEVQLNRQIDWCERLELQQATLQSILSAAMQVYAEQTGELFAMPAMAGPAPKREFSTAGMERAKRFAVGSPEVPQSKRA